MEKEGSITNSGRWMQWRYKGANPPGDALPDAEIITGLVARLKAMYGKEGGPFPEQITKLTWDYEHDGKVCAHAVAKEVNGYFLKDVEVKGKPFKKGELVPSFAYLLDDGSTSSGNWLYCNSYTEKGNMAARRDNTDSSGIGLYANWSWCWPVNRRILYNRASVDLNGNPWDKAQPVIRWDPAAKDGKGTWVGDVPDGGWPPMAVNPEATKRPFIMKPDGVASVFGPGRAEGPFPEHYEPLECPTKNLMSSQQLNPAIVRWDKIGSEMDKYAAVCDPRYPIVATTYRVSEHWQTGAMTRNVPWLVELQPNMFVEMSKELAKMKGIKNGETVKVISSRSEIKAVAIVTDRFKPFKIGDPPQEVHQIGLPWCFGFMGFARGDSANKLAPNIGDANTMIPESKAFLVDVRKEV